MKSSKFQNPFKIMYSYIGAVTLYLLWVIGLWLFSVALGQAPLSHPSFLEVIIFSFTVFPLPSLSFLVFGFALGWIVFLLMARKKK